ncbi:MAG: acyltransferase [Deltaproteobacteria bacterium]|nr:acyltransferase [Deltaproteobacteria bacterium]
MTDTEVAEPASRPFLPALDGLRGIATMLVMLTHLPDQAFPDWFDRLSRGIAYGALDCFFVLSGFLITRILLAERAAGRPLGRFFIRRFLRLIPAFWILVAAVHLWEPSLSSLWAVLYVINYTLPFHVVAHPLGHTWSLAVEEQFYLTWPWVVRGLTTERSWWVLTRLVLPGSISAALVTLLFTGILPVKAIIYMGTPYRALSLGLGAAMAYREVVVRSEHGVPWQRAALAGSVVVGVLGAFAGPFRPAFSMVAYSLLSSGILLTLLVPRFRRAQAFVDLAPFRYAGKISYGLYLYHLPIYFALGFREGWVGRPKMVFAVMLVFAAASLSYFLVEEPILRLKRYFR